MSAESTRHCPTPRALAKFIDGRSSPSELVAITDHLNGCSRCRSIVETAAEEEQESEIVPIKQTRWWWLAAAAVVVMPIALVPLWRSRRDPIAQLVEAAPTTSRSVDGRLTGGFRWAPLDPDRGESIFKKPEDLQLSGEAGKILKKLDGNDSVSALQATAIARLLIDEPADAIARLERATRMRPDDPLLWSDLAAARLQSAGKNIADLGPALSAADRAIALSPRLPEASFNRALILERLGIRDLARAAWKNYLRIDPASQWAGEAREHLRRLGPRTGIDEERQRIFKTAQGTKAIEMFAAAHPCESRTYCEGPLSSQWASAIHAGNTVGGANLMNQLNAVATSLSARGEHFLEDALAAALIAEHDPAARSVLIDAYAAYDSGRGRYRDGRPSEAEPLLRRAAALFERVKSPMAANATYFLANTISTQTRVAEARSIYERLIREVNRHRYPTLVAQIQWELGRCDCYEGVWSRCMARLQDARQLFEERGETLNAAFIDAILAEADDRMARVEEGWRRRVVALDAFSAAGNHYRVAGILNGAVRAESFRSEHDSALSLAALAIGWSSGKDGYEELLADAVIHRTIVLRDAGRLDRAHQSLGEARAVAMSMKDLAMRELRMTEVDVVESSLLRASNPAKAIALMDRAVDFYRARHHAMWVPRALLERGRAFRAAGDMTRALADFEAGVAEVEQQRSTIEEEQRRFGFFDTVPELFAEAIALQLAGSDIESAYHTAERARARTLYEHLGIPIASSSIPSADALHRSLDSETVVVAYQLLPSRLAIFCIDRDSIRVAQRAVDQDEIRRVTRALVASIRDEGATDFRSAATDAWRLLIEPVANDLDRRKRVIFVPDRFLHSITFPALFDPRSSEFLVEQHEIVIAPSAALAPIDAQPKITTTPALVVGDPASASDESLPYAEAEARDVAALHHVAPLIGAEATRSAFVARAPRSALIHYGGHARSSDDDLGGRLLLAGEGEEAMLTASEIARLRLGGTSLVTLAACGTFRGRADRIEGMPSLARAFIAAGVPYVVGTLWNVPDEGTADLFVEFHRRLAAGASPAAALQQAQIAELKRGVNRRPTWATVAVMGAQISNRERRE